MPVRVYLCFHGIVSSTRSMDLKGFCRGPGPGLDRHVLQPTIYLASYGYIMPSSTSLKAETEPSSLAQPSPAQPWPRHQEPYQDSLLSDLTPWRNGRQFTSPANVAWGTAPWAHRARISSRYIVKALAGKKAKGEAGCGSVIEGTAVPWPEFPTV